MRPYMPRKPGHYRKGNTKAGSIQHVAIEEYGKDQIDRGEIIRGGNTDGDEQRLLINTIKT